jgi:hypothetical protein
MAEYVVGLQHKRRSLKANYNTEEKNYGKHMADISRQIHSLLFSFTSNADHDAYQNFQ